MKSVLLFISSLFVCAAALAAVNLNTASQQELESLKGVGPSKARAIIEYRKQHGPFKSVQELNDVPGFGEKTVRKLEADLILTGPTVITPTK
jgi:competence protein ComEA